MTTTWRALVVDDEPLAREGLRVRLESLGGFDVSECSTAYAAVAAVRAQRPDVVFLDVQMPGATGLDVVHEIGAEHMPVLVFVTAFDRYAIDAFDAEAADYVVKPIDDARFEQTVRRVRRRLEEARDGRVGRRVSQAIDEVREAPRRAERASAVARGAEGRLVLRDGGRVVVVPMAEIEWIEADGDYVRVHARGRDVLVRETLARMERTLDPAAFVRIHRSAIVAVAHVREAVALPNNDYVVHLRGGAELRASRSYSARLLRALGLDG